MVRQHHQLSGHEFEQTPGDSGGQRSLVCSSPLHTPWCKEFDTTQRLNNSDISILFLDIQVYRYMKSRCVMQYKPFMFACPLSDHLCRGQTLITIQGYSFIGRGSSWHIVSPNIIMLDSMRRPGFNSWLHSSLVVWCKFFLETDFLSVK